MPYKIGLTALSSEAPLHIAFSNICSQQWIAGCHYLRNLFTALCSVATPPDLILYGKSRDASQEILSGYLAQTLVSPVDSRQLLQLALRAERRYGLPLGMGWYETRFLREQRVQVMFAMIDHGDWFHIPLMGWIPDFQHIHLPDMFSVAELQYRDRTYLQTAQRADRVILSSHSALTDLEQFAPEYAAKGRVVHFVAAISPNVYATDPAWVCEQYHLPERFIYMPNQFWKHKNHRLVIDALRIAHAKNTEVVVVCTGNTADSRHPDYFAELQSAIDRFGLADSFRILGMIPHEHILALMRQSIAVLQPSLFEGWNTSVEETKSIGKRIILSDLAVHREQNPAMAMYFGPHDPDALANALLSTFDQARPGPDLALEDAAQKELPHRLNAYGESFLRVAQEIV